MAYGQLESLVCIAIELYYFSFVCLLFFVVVAFVVVVVCVCVCVWHLRMLQPGLAYAGNNVLQRTDSSHVMMLVRCILNF